MTLFCHVILLILCIEYQYIIIGESGEDWIGRWATLIFVFFKFGICTKIFDHTRSKQSLRQEEISEIF